LDPRYGKLCRKLGLGFSREDLLEIALTHRSHGIPNNERLEFLGDAVLNLVISAVLYRKFPASDEGTLSRLRANLVNGETLADVARRLDLGDDLRLGPGELKSGGYRRDSILAGALESVIGAAWLDGGYEVAREFTERIFEPEVDAVSLDRAIKDPKTRLQEWLQARQRALPEYEVVATAGRDHARIFRVACRVDGLAEPVEGEGGSRRKAEQDAAGRALSMLQQHGQG
jgi:ribonuclease III